jgi:thiol-disulfide isomerase/thioredoxin
MIVDSANRPVAGAQVALKIPSSKLRLSGQTSFSGVGKDVIRLTDADGKFRLNDDAASQGLVAVHDEGFAELGTNELATNLTIRLQGWGKLTGTVWNYDKPVINQEVWAQLANQGWPQSFGVNFRTNTDAQGNFAFNFVPAGKYMVYRMIPMGQGAAGGPQEIARVQPGETATVKLGGSGRAVTGRFKITNPYVPIDWPGRNNYLYAHSVRPKPPEGLKTREEFDAWMNRPEIQRANDAARNYPIQTAAGGSFRMDEVIPGKYEMQIQIYDPRDPEALAYSKYICNESKSFEVPESNDKGPLDIGVIELTLKADIKRGETAAADFEASDMADKKFRLADFRGKYVLLDFWATWCGPCIGEMPYLKQVHEKFKGRKDFVMVSLSVDKSANEPRDFLKKNELPWVQGYLGDWSQTKVPREYGVQGIPAIFLIGPDGKIIETELEGSSMAGRIEKYLK